MGVSNRLLHVSGTAGCRPLPALPLVTIPLAFLGCLEQHINALESSRENSKSHVGALFFFLVLTTSGKNLDENRGAAGMIEEGFFCVVLFFKVGFARKATHLFRQGLNCGRRW